MATAVHVDKALARKILAGDEQAFRDLFDRFFPRLYRFGLARLDGDHDAATEVVQQTFCKAFERLDTYRGVSVFKQMGQMFGLAKGVFCASFSCYAACR